MGNFASWVMGGCYFSKDDRNYEHRPIEHRRHVGHVYRPATEIAVTQDDGAQQYVENKPTAPQMDSLAYVPVTEVYRYPDQVADSLQYVSGLDVRRCPGCRMPFTKEYRGNLITCKQCDTTFCFVCYEIQVDLSHFCDHDEMFDDKCEDHNKCCLFTGEDEFYLAPSPEAGIEKEYVHVIGFPEDNMDSLEYVQGLDIHRCANCNMRYTKDDGDNFITCNQCQVKSCFICSQANITFEHFCSHEESVGDFCPIHNKCNFHSDHRDIVDMQGLDVVWENDLDILGAAAPPQQDMAPNIAGAGGERMVVCSVCICDSLPEDMVTCPEGHSFCKDCVQQYVHTNIIGQGKTDAKCMNDGCKQNFHPGILANVLTSATLEQLGALKMEDELNRADLPGLVRCPYCNMAAVLDDEHQFFPCPSDTCGKVSCRRCHQDEGLHRNGVCQRDGDDTDRQRLALEEIMDAAVIRRCGECKRKFVKDSGCNKMTCQCGATMCYLCRKMNIDYKHYCDHPRDPGKQCNKCTMCSLWENPENEEERAANLAQVDGDVIQPAGNGNDYEAPVVPGETQVHWMDQHHPRRREDRHVGRREDRHARREERQAERQTQKAERRAAREVRRMVRLLDPRRIRNRAGKKNKDTNYEDNIPQITEPWNLP